MSIQRNKIIFTTADEMKKNKIGELWLDESSIMPISVMAIIITNVAMKWVITYC